jgi:serine/threonine protein kinase
MTKGSLGVVGLAVYKDGKAAEGPDDDDGDGDIAAGTGDSDSRARRGSFFGSRRQSASLSSIRKPSVAVAVGSRRGSSFKGIMEYVGLSSPAPATTATEGGSAKKNVYFLKATSKSACDERSAQRALEEAEVLARAHWRHPMQRHPFIVYLAGTFQTPHTCTLVLDPVDSPCDLWTLIYGTETGGVVYPAPRDSTRTHPEQAPLLDPALVRFYAASVASALSHLHAADIAHRNLRAENVLLDRNGYIRLVGFGCAKRFPYHHQSDAGDVGGAPSSSLWLMSKTYTVCGSAEYMAPEMVVVNGHGPAVDAWALGVTLAEALTGAAAPLAPSPRAAADVESKPSSSSFFSRKKRSLTASTRASAAASRLSATQR